jgi:hypothetical protein
MPRPVGERVIESPSEARESLLMLGSLRPKLTSVLRPQMLEFILRRFLIVLRVIQLSPHCRRIGFSLFRRHL